MSNDKYYIPGTFYRICDRTGFKVRSFETKKEWNNSIVRERSWEIRQPQDFVRGVKDNQTVQEARPRQVNVFVSIATNISVFAPLGQNFIIVDSTQGMNPGGTLYIIMDNGETCLAIISSIVGDQINLLGTLPFSTSPINQVSYTPIDLGPPGQYLLTQDGKIIETQSGLGILL